MQVFADEKRQDTRLNFCAPLRYQIRGSQEFGNTVTKNISNGGVSFVTNTFIKPETRVTLDINVLAKSINTIAAVRWAEALPHSNKYQVGLQFIRLEPQDKNYLADYINLRQHKDGF